VPWYIVGDTLEGCEWLRFLLSVGFGSLRRQHAEYPHLGVLLRMESFGEGEGPICVGISPLKIQTKCKVAKRNMWLEGVS